MKSLMIKAATKLVRDVANNPRHTVLSAEHAVRDNYPSLDEDDLDIHGIFNGRRKEILAWNNL